MPTVVDKETGAVVDVPDSHGAIGPAISPQEAADYISRQKERRHAKQERIDTELEEQRTPYLAEVDRLQSELDRALAEVRSASFEVDCSSKRAAKKSVERQVVLSAALAVAASVERRLHDAERQLREVETKGLPS